MNLGLAITNLPEPVLYFMNGLVLLLLSTLTRRIMAKASAAPQDEEEAGRLHVRIRNRNVVAMKRRSGIVEGEFALRRASNY